MIIENQASVTDAVAEAFGRTADPRAARDPAGAGAASARLHPRGPAHRAGVPGGHAADRGHGPAHHGLAQRGGADGRLARASRPSSASSTTATTARPRRRPTCWGPSGARTSRCAPAAPASCARRRPGRRWSRMCGSRTATGGPVAGRRGGRVALLARGALREPGPGPSRDEPARPLPHGRRRAVPFPSVKPAGYPIPIDGPVGELVKATGRHNYRPAHLHFMIYKPGFKTLISQIYVPDDEHLDSDVQFGVTRALIGDYVRHDEPEAEPRLQGALVFPRPALRAGARRGPPPQAADPRQGVGRKRRQPYCADRPVQRRNTLAPLRPTDYGRGPSRNAAARTRA